MQLTCEPFGITRDGEAVARFNLCNSAGTRISLISYGATLISLQTPDRNGVSDDLVLGFDSLAEYEDNEAYIGAIVGRYANRIAAGQLVIDGQAYQLSCNEGPNQLHGGFKGLNNRVWQTRELNQSDAVGVEFSTRLADGLDGYPGNLDVSVQVWLNSDNELRFDFGAVTDKTTVVNLSHHGYFNLAGRYSGNCHQQLLWIDADRYTPVDAELIPTGVLESVSGTAFDFRHAKPIARDSGAPAGQPRGFDHNWVLNKAPGELAKVAQLSDPNSGRRMQILTTQPGLQFYAGQYMDIPARDSHSGFVSGSGVCLETQHFPDSPNQPHFPTTLLPPEQQYRESAVYKFDLLPQ